MGSLSHGDAEAAGGAGSGGRMDGCGCWITPEGGSALLIPPQMPPCAAAAAAAAAATQHLTSLAQQLHSSLHSHPLTRLLLDDLDVDLEGEQRLSAGDVGLAAASRDLRSQGAMCDTGDVRLQAAKRCEFGETQFENASGETECASVAKRMRTEQAVLSL